MYKRAAFRHCDKWSSSSAGSDATETPAERQKQRIVAGGGWRP